MKTRITILCTLLFVNYTLAFSQYEDCFKVDDTSLLAINLESSSNYDGTCQKHFTNDQIAWRLIIKDGSPIEMKQWRKNGQLADSTVYIDGFKLFKRFTFDRKGRVISEELLEMKSIAQSGDKEVFKMAQKKKYAHSTVYEDCLSYKSISYSKNNTPKFVYHTMYDQSKTLLVQYHKNGNVSDSIFYKNKSVGESEYILVKEGASIQYDLAENKSAIKRFENDKIVNETLFESTNKTLELDYENGRLAKDAKLISVDGENIKVCVKLDWQGNPKIYE
ncbi:hypothetical protein [Carboxylicivirga sp. N1Y90]|uniref:hypothetical protein n=1 Tax=Carboxylicivirga fragile TaxID=3417571 RepID=UPI003D338FB2|nr:hypothetical protein [Marinilabiliaceae bacterium N1Y90]